MIVTTNNTNYALSGSVISFKLEDNMQLECDDEGIVISDNSIIITNNAPPNFTINCVSEKNEISFNYIVVESINDDKLMLVNLYSEVDAEIERKINLGYFMGKRVSTRIIPDLKELIIDAYKNEIYLYVDSAYRSHKHQKLVYEKYKNRAIAPGKSEHETGLAVDLLWGGVTIC